MPRWVSVGENALSNTRKIGADCMGSLVSLTYNRGASYAKDGDRYREMRAIQAAHGGKCVHPQSRRRCDP
jgi:hypothetical protein